MYEGFVEYAGVEIINAARTRAYVEAFLPQIQWRCAETTLPAALGHSEYTDPGRDIAPWYKGDRAAGQRFYGLFPGKFTGAEDSTRTVTVTDLPIGGSAATSPRYGAKEIRFTATAFAADEEAMEEGMAWLRQALAHDGCSNNDLGCTGHPLKMFAALPEDIVAAFDLARTFHKVDITEAPTVIEKLNSKAGCLWRLEFTATAGRPWAFTSTHEVGVLDMDSSTNFQDPAGENCGTNLDGYDDFVDDPFFTGISRPPRAPAILPPNLLNVHSWRRRTIEIPEVHSSQWGRTVPVVNIRTELAVSHLRLRFYREGAVSCDFDGEFYVSYIPDTATLTLDAITQEATLTLSDGRVVPAGNLLFGSDGRPVTWPSLGCQRKYFMTADLMPGQAGVAVLLDVAVRL